MQLGLVMTGYGACAAVNLGVLRALEERGIAPYAVCGLHAGAWPAALYLAGHDGLVMRSAICQASRMGLRMLPVRGIPSLVRGRRESLCDGRRLEHLLLAQTGQKLLALCARRGMFLCRSAHSSGRVIFATRDILRQDMETVCMQASVSFAARAAMSLPPFLPPSHWMGMTLLAEGDIAFACKGLAQMGAQRVLVVMPVLSAGRNMDALDLTGAAADITHRLQLPKEAALVRVPLPAQLGALSLGKLEAMEHAGHTAAQRELDGALTQLGMAQCRVLVFRRTTV